MTVFNLWKITRLPTTILFIAGLLFIFAQPTIANELPVLPTDHVADSEVIADFVGWCPSDPNICRVNREWTIKVLQQKLGNNQWAVWQESDQLIFAFRGRVEDVFINGAISTSLVPVKDSDYWVATIQIRNLDHAIVSYIFGTVQQGGSQIIRDSYGTWRGPHAPKSPESAQPSYLMRWSLYSPELDEIRWVSVYLPPNYSPDTTYPVVYMADGQWLEDFAIFVEPLIQKGIIPPTIMIGVHAALFDPTRNRRAEEYILSVNDEAYTAHERFFTRTVRRWAELQFGASQDPSERAIIGFSNSAVFAGNTGVRKPNLYGHVMMFSASQQPQVTLRSRIDARYYLLAGTLEPPIYAQTQNFYFSLLLLNAEVQFSRRVAGHDGVMWQEEFIGAMRWMFRSDD